MYRSHLELADVLRENGRLEESIVAYKAHIKERLANPKRLPEENPYFYYLIIGDIYLQKGKTPDSSGDRVEKTLVQKEAIEEAAIEQARAAYEFALANNANKELCAERLRRLGVFYEEQGDYEKAFAVVEQYRDLDPLLYDLEIDRLHKAMIKLEQHD